MKPIRLIAALFVAQALLTTQICCRQNPPSGFLKKTYTDSNGKTSHYVLFVPLKRKKERKLPVILFLNGWGENGDDGLRQISNNFGADVWRMRGHFPFLAVCPQCSYHGTWRPDSPNARKALAILDDVISQYDGDPDRVYITGASNGGAGALDLAAAFPDRFAAVVPVAAAAAGDREKLVASRMPIWAFYNNRDATNLVESAREMRKLLIENGLSPLVTEFDQSSHNAWDATYGSPAMFGWLLRQNRVGRSDQPLFELFNVDDIPKTWEKRGANTWVAENNDELITEGVQPGEHAILVAPPQVVEGEFHCDVLLTAGSQARFSLFPSEKELAPYEVVLSLPSDGVSGYGQLHEDWIGQLDSVGRLAVVSGWNDIRLARKGGHLTMQINGWPALNIDDPFSGMPVQWGIGTTSQDVLRWRYLRHCNMRKNES